MAFVKSFTIDDYGVDIGIDYDDVHNWLEEIAQKYKRIEIIVAVTPVFVESNKDKTKLIEWLQGCRQSNIKIASHGYSHTDDDEPTEFFHFNRSVPITIQQEKLRRMKVWFDTNSLSNDYFVPPAHGWERGVTDKILSNLDYKELFSREVEKRSLSDIQGIFKQGIIKYRFKPSANMVMRWRLGLFLPYDSKIVPLLTKIKTWLYQYIHLTVIQIILLRSRHNFLTELDMFIHVQNLVNESSRNSIENIINRLSQSKH